MLSRYEILEILEREKAFLLQKFDVKEIALFGSCARDDADEESDIDLFVRFGKVSYDNFFELKEYLTHKLQRKVDIVIESKYMKPRNRAMIERDMIYV